MEKGKIRMLANLIELNKIEVRLSKKYCGGISPKFYLRDLNKETLVEIPVAETCEDDICVKYYFKNVHIDLTHHYEMVDNYGLSAILQYVRLSELDDFDELFYYDGKLGPLYQKEKTTFKVWAPTALEVMVKVGNVLNKNKIECVFPWLIFFWIIFFIVIMFLYRIPLNKWIG